jgi:hypothetical protein
MVVRSVCGRSITGIACSNFPWDMDVCYESCVLLGADSSSRGILPILCVLERVIRCDNNSLQLQWVGWRGQTRKERKVFVNCLNRIYLWKLLPQHIKKKMNYIKISVLGASGSRSETPGKFWNVVLEKDGKDQLDWSCEKWRCIT